MSIFSYVYIGVPGSWRCGARPPDALPSRRPGSPLRSLAVSDDETDRWRELQEATRECPACAVMEGILFSRFLHGWPEIPEPASGAILFISEAPLPDGGFWTIQPPGRKQDDLREKLLPLVGLETTRDDRSLKRFVEGGFFLLQAFRRPAEVLRGRP